MTCTLVLATGPDEDFTELSRLLKAQTQLYRGCESGAQLKNVCRDLDWVFVHQRDPETYVVFTPAWFAGVEPCGGLN